MDGDQAMQLPQKGKFEWNFNTWVTAGGVLAGMLVTATGWGITYADMRNDNERLQSQISDLTARYQESFKDITLQIAQIQPLAFQTTRAIEGVAENKKGVEAANSRIDRVVESLGGKLDTAIESINKVATRVEVLSSKLDDAREKADKTRLQQPVWRP
jgi:methyl-accepting chemotaxis protein